MEVTLTVISGLLGAAIGSFLNVCIDRLPRGKSLVRPPSHCDRCQHPLSPRDLVPVFSYLWLRGRCRYCRAPVPPRSIWVETVTGLLFAFLYWRYGWSVETAIVALYCCLFIVLMVIDLEHKLILNRIVYPAALVAVIINVPVINEMLHQPGITMAMIGGAVGFVFLLVPALINPAGMGLGDVKMAGLIGLVTGFPLVVVALGIGIILGGVAAALLLLLRIKKRKEGIPFGPFLSLGTMVTLLWGPQILNWYLAFYR